MILLDFPLILIITVMIQVAVLNRFLWNSHGWCEYTHGWTTLFFWETIGPITDMGKNMLPNQIFWLSFSQYGGFLWQKFQSRIQYPISHRKSYIHFCHPFPGKMVMPSKIIFRGYFGKYFFVVFCFFGKIVKWKIFKSSSYKKVYINFCRQTLLPLKMVISSHKWFFKIFST